MSQKDKPMVQFNEKGFVLNYSVTRNEEIAYIDYEQGSITFKQMPIPLDKVQEIVKYFNETKEDYNKFKSVNKEQVNESNNSKGSK